MKIESENILIRDYMHSDISDDLKWFNEDIDWIKQDTPWEVPEKVNEKEYIKEMEKYLKTRNPNQLESRYEIEINNVHAGFVTNYVINYKDLCINNKIAIGIEICDAQFRNKKYGRKILNLFINFLFKNSINEIYLETHSKNIPMVKCAENVGFEIINVIKDKWKSGNKIYDQILMKLTKFK